MAGAGRARLEYPQGRPDKHEAEHELHRASGHVADKETARRTPRHGPGRHRQHDPPPVAYRLERARARCRARPTSIVGMLMRRLMVPAAFIGMANASTSVGMISSPPATPEQRTHRADPHPDGDGDERPAPRSRRAGPVTSTSPAIPR